MKPTDEARDGARSDPPSRPAVEPGPGAPLAAEPQAAPGFAEQMVRLYAQVSHQLPARDGGAGRVVQFIGASAGSGTSTVAQAYAEAARDATGARVLLIDADRRAPSASRRWAHHIPVSLEDVALGSATLADGIIAVGNTGLSIASLSLRPGTPVPPAHSPAFARLFEDLKGRFDHIVIDAPPMADTADGTLVSRYADGVILVVEAEVLSRRAALKLKTLVQRAGGTPLGVVFNKRRQWLPAWLYRRLA
ncbi:tyrosine-protein kinase family protein [Zavarzinia sp. CC-PAN008]|uniref:tyrosine-protein kinase family protein n=1 Tax=Zavarzinia sp. CC-PAN008 TaxID=3243332 RepID=UPI003F749115